MTTDAVRFGNYRLDIPNRKVLREDGKAVALYSKEFEMLCLLVTAKGDVVKKEEIISCVWPDGGVAESNLSRIASMLRAALGPTVIVNVVGVGYRLGVPVESISLHESAAEE